MHHYNFPPYSTGEAGFMRGPEAPRDRSRSTRREGDPSGDPVGRGVPLRDPGSHRDHVVERLDLDGERLRFVAVADGRPAFRSAAASTSVVSPWASSPKAASSSR